MKMTFKERLDLGAHLARTQTMVMRVFSNAFDQNRSEQLEMFEVGFTATLCEADQSMRVQIVDGTEMCIGVLSQRYRQLAVSDLDEERASRIEKALDLAISRAIDRLAELEMLAQEQSTPAFAFG